MSSEKAAFKKNRTKDLVKPFQVRLDFISGLYLGAGFAAVNLVVSLLQLLVQYVFFTFAG